MVTAAFMFLLLRELLWAWDHSKHEAAFHLEYWKRVASTCAWLVLLYAVAALVTMGIRF